jgi:hypothetical protein
MQEGGSGITTEPTVFVTSENYQPERFSFTPLGGSVGGSVTHQWGGGSIPVHGTGELSGMDLNEIGDAIAQGLMTELSIRVQQLGGRHA